MQWRIKVVRDSQFSFHCANSLPMVLPSRHGLGKRTSVLGDNDYLAGTGLMSQLGDVSFRWVYWIRYDVSLRIHGVSPVGK